jgi:predicted membrane-bound spermidine synthase
MPSRTPLIKNLRARHASVSCLSADCAYAGNLAVTLSFDGLLSRLGLGGTYLLYGLANVGAALYVGQLLVETRCR